MDINSITIRLSDIKKEIDQGYKDAKTNTEKARLDAASSALYEAIENLALIKYEDD